MSIRKCYNVADVRNLAQRRLPAPMFHYIDGGADDERTLRANSDAFDAWQLMPECLRDVSTIDLSTTVMGQSIQLPLFCAPTGMSRLFHHDRELAVARAAEKFGIFYSLSTLGTTTIEDIAATIRSPKMFQIYILKDRGLTLEFVQRCHVAGYDALCLTVDMAMAGNRERDLRTGMTMPPRFGLNSLWSFATHPVWAVNFLLKPDFRLANVAHRVDALGGGSMGLIDYVNSQFDRTVTWADVEWLRRHWRGKLVIKGILSPNDAARARSIGIDAIMISNHGGRQLDGVPAPIQQLQPIRDAVGADVDLIVDGGIRRGTQIVTAIALGANACSIGKAYLYGLGAGGQAGVEHVFALLKSEVERALVLLGCRSVADLSERHVTMLGYAKKSHSESATNL